MTIDCHEGEKPYHNYWEKWYTKYRLYQQSYVCTQKKVSVGDDNK